MCVYVCTSVSDSILCIYSVVSLYDIFNSRVYTKFTIIEVKFNEKHTHTEQWREENTGANESIIEKFV